MEMNRSVETASGQSHDTAKSQPTTLTAGFIANAASVAIPVPRSRKIPGRILSRVNIEPLNQTGIPKPATPVGPDRQEIPSCPAQGRMTAMMTPYSLIWIRTSLPLRASEMSVWL